uniref:Zgc:194990 n=1 Tax=Gadus morhua TaxID=8049 RepID=A0A8C4Z6A2_GADMO
MMKDCLQFLVEPAKKLKIRLKETRKRVRNDRKEPLVESQLFIMELARELNKMCQRSHVLSHIWTFEDSWPASVCRDFIVEWAAVIEKRTESQAERTEKRDWKGHLLCMLEAGGEYEMAPHKRVILDWASIWPGEPVLMMLDDLEFQWKRGRLPNLLPAMELIMLALLNAQSPEKVWLSDRNLTTCEAIECRKVGNVYCRALMYPFCSFSVWNWICEAAEDVLLDPDTANGDLLISDDAKRMRCGVEGGDAPCCARRFDGWRCAAARRGYASGRRYWEVEVGDRDWRLGVAKARAPRRGYRALNADSGYLTLRLERGSELKALTVPATPLAPGLAPPRRVGVYLDYEQGQLSFYDAQRRAHLYTYNERFTEELTPVFGTVEAMKDLVIRPAAVRGPCLCPGPCLWN